MQHGNRLRFVVLIIAGLQLTACQQKSDAPAHIDPAMVEYTGEALYRVRLTAKRAEQLGIKTAPVREANLSGILRKVIPAAAVVYDQHGNTWTFRNPDSLVFVRERISVQNVEADLAILLDGPPVGTAVVTVGAAELLRDRDSNDTDGAAERTMSEDDEGKKWAGTATMLEDGTIRLAHRAAGVTGLAASVVIVYKPQDEEYQKIIDHVGGLMVGETKNVPPWPDK